MISIDRKVSRSLLRLTHSYDLEIFFSPGRDCFSLVHDAETPERSVPFPAPAAEILPSLDRLNRSGLIRYTVKVWGDERYFHITPELLHAKAFWWDRFTKTYVAGFISGVATSVAAGLILHFLIGLF